MTEENVRVIVRIKPISPEKENCIQVNGNQRLKVITSLRAPQSISRRSSKGKVVNTPVLTKGSSGTRRLSFTPCEINNSKSSDLTNHTAPIQFPKSETRKRRSSRGVESTTFQFDNIFTEEAQQEDIFGEIYPFVLDAIAGYNTCIFAYGQTGSGKTYTMMGTDDALGVIPRTVQTIFDEISYIKDCSFRIHCSYVELYLDQITDLLDPDNDPALLKKMNTSQLQERGRKKKVEIRQNGNEIFLSGDSNTLNSHVRSFDEAMKLIEHGRKCRTVAFTSLNSQSSRSHAIITFVIEKKDRQGKITKGKIHLVDLAGNERISQSKVSGDTMKEAQKINQSLNVLGRVLSSLAAKKKVIPYRDSNLTRLLQDSLGCDSKTCFVVNIRPDAKFSQETIQSLSYGQQAKLIRISSTIHEEIPFQSSASSATISKLESEIEELKAKLKSKNEDYDKLEQDSAQSISDNKQLRRRIRNITIQHKQRCEQYQRKIDNLIHSQSTQLAENHYQFLKLQENIGCYRKQNYDLTCQLGQYHQKTYLLNTHTQQSQQEIVVLQDNTEKLLLERDELQKNLIECTKLLKDQQEELQKQQENSKTFEKLEEENEKLVKKIEEMNSIIEELQEKLDSIPLPDDITESESESEILNEDSSSDKINEEDDIMNDEDELFDDSIIPLDEADDDFQIGGKKTTVKTPKNTGGKRKGKKTPKLIGRKRKSTDFFVSTDTSATDVSPTPFLIEQVKHIRKKQRVNNSDNGALITLEGSPILKEKIKNTPKQKKAVLNAFLKASNSRFTNSMNLPSQRLEIEEDKENFDLL